MKPACPRSFEAEALRDGRLVGSELAAFERHLSVCPHCAREVEALQTLGDALRAPGRGPEDADELHVRRERTRLLAAFDAALVPPEQTRNIRGVFLGFAAAAAILVALFVYFRARAVAPGIGATHAVVVHADSNASWSRRSDGAIEKILLAQGALSIRVDPALALGHRRLLVVLPDGELEDIGTTFTVSADAGRTTRVSVQSGSVVLRLHGQPPLALGAGDAWTPTPRAAASTCTSCEPAPVAAPSLAPVASRSAASASALSSAPGRRVLAVSTSSAATGAPHSAASAPPPAASPALSASAPPEPDSSRDFRAAMTALDGGDNHTAAARFAGFLAAYPRDARAEDAAYLRIIALQRASDPGGMKEAAAQYLRRYSKGFRRAEVEALAH